MRNIFNTSYKVKSDVNTEEERLSFSIKDGAYVTTSSGVWTIWNGEWVKLYPQAGAGTGLGWSRYDDGQYTSASKLSIAQDTEIVLPNNAATSYRSYTGVDYYDSSTSKVLADNENDVYIMTIVFNASASNANSTYLEVSLQGVNGTPYDRIRNTISFPKGNDVEHSEHMVFQYYADSSFAANGSQVNIEAIGGTAQVWDIIYFIQKTQSYA